MKKLYIKPAALYVELLLEGNVCCSRGICDNCLDEEDDDDDGDGSGSGGGIFADAYGYRPPIWED